MKVLCAAYRMSDSVAGARIEAWSLSMDSKYSGTNYITHLSDFEEFITKECQLKCLKLASAIVYR
ncbi:MAG: hypothetical protein COY82_00320, partial [Parcubacteria group bacterium CG_4_10_14_0_8_um_filter_35_7]